MLGVRIIRVTDLSFCNVTDLGLLDSISDLLVYSALAGREFNLNRGSLGPVSFDVDSASRLLAWTCSWSFMMVQRRSFLLLGIVTFAIAMRVIPYVLQGLGVTATTDSLFYPWNLSPLTAVCLFGGAFFAELKRLAFGVPLVVLALSDVAIGLLMGDVGFAVHTGTPFVYSSSFALSVCLGRWLQKHRSSIGCCVERRCCPSACSSL